MPGWYQQFKDVSDVQIVGLIQEQHPERCQLFMKWRQMDFPILVDALNRIGVHAVPLMWAIDEHGVVRKTQPRESWIKNEFISTEYEAPSEEGEFEEPSIGVEAYLDAEWSEAISAFKEEIDADESSATAWFRLGCSYRARHDSQDAMERDFQDAIAAWTKALNLYPANYIFRRRVEQYGPRLMKPYPFYTWVEEALKEVAEREGEPFLLSVSLEGSEIAEPEGRGSAAKEAVSTAAQEPDPEAKIPADSGGLVAFSGVVAPMPVNAGQKARVYLRFEPSQMKAVTWDNEAGELEVWIKSADGLVLSQQSLLSGLGSEASSNELRSLELELAVDESADLGERKLEGYALYYVCEGEEGACVYMRQDFSLDFNIVKGPARRGRRGR
ncbi:MAG: TlpA family protein disulfide reductase [Planctomycetota bacterium]